MPVEDVDHPIVDLYFRGEFKFRADVNTVSQPVQFAACSKWVPVETYLHPDAQEAAKCFLQVEGSRRHTVAPTAIVSAGAFTSRYCHPFVSGTALVRQTGSSTPPERVISQASCFVSFHAMFLVVGWNWSVLVFPRKSS